MARGADALFELGRQTLRALSDELAARQVYVDPGLELRRGNSLLCYYSFQDGHIYLSVPDVEQPRGKFELFFLRSVVGFNSNGAIIRLLEFLIPWLVAHEVGHHLRHKYGLLDFDFHGHLLEGIMWDEEQIANRLAGAFIKHHLTADQKKELLDILSRAIANLSNSLHAHGNVEEMHPARDPVGYVYFHLRWFYLDLKAQERSTQEEHELSTIWGKGGQSSLDEFVQVYLRQAG